MVYEILIAIAVIRKRLILINFDSNVKFKINQCLNGCTHAFTHRVMEIFMK